MIYDDLHAAITEALSATHYSIEAAGLNKWFGRTRALYDVSLQAPWGCVVALFGPNGAGKSTLLRLLAALTSADSGSARVADCDLRRDAMDVRRAVGYAGHANYLYADLTARENLRFHARLHRLAGADERISALLDHVGLAKRADARARTLSNGMQKRLAIARAILHRPRVLLLDEPEAGLDEQGLELVNHIVLGLAKAGGTVVWSTHAVDRGLQLAERAAVLNDGALVMDAETSGLSASAIHAAFGQGERTA